jgi:hypothetical protein
MKILKRNKTDARIDSDYRINEEEFKRVGGQSPNRRLSEKRNSHMIDFLLNIDNILNPNKPKFAQKALAEEDEDGKIENSNPFIDNQRYQRQVVDKNLLELNEYNERQSHSQRSSVMKSSSRNSFPSYVDEKLETKEGWLLKRSFTKPSIIGWQKRYCQIRGQKFLYYKSNDMTKLDGVIDFNLLTCLITVPKDTAVEGIAGKLHFDQISKSGINA